MIAVVLVSSFIDVNVNTIGLEIGLEVTFLRLSAAATWIAFGFLLRGSLRLLLCVGELALQPLILLHNVFEVTLVGLDLRFVDVSHQADAGLQQFGHVLLRQFVVVFRAEGLDRLDVFFELS